MRLKCTQSLGLQDPQATEQGHPHPCCEGQEAGLRRTAHPALRQHLQVPEDPPNWKPKGQCQGGKPHCRRQERGFYQKRLKKKNSQNNVENSKSFPAPRTHQRAVSKVAQNTGRKREAIISKTQGHGEA